MPRGVVISSPKGGLVWVHGEDADGNAVKLRVDANGYLLASPGRVDALWEMVEVESLPTGFQNFTGATVPAGEVWVVTQVMMYMSGTPPSSMQVAVLRGTDLQVLYETVLVTSTEYYAATVNAVMEEGDRVRGVMDETTSGDYGLMIYSGYKYEA